MFAEICSNIVFGFAEAKASASSDPSLLCFQEGHENVRLSEGGLAAARSPLEANDAQPEEFAHTSVDTVASYGQLLNASPAEDEALFDQVELQMGEQQAIKEGQSSKSAQCTYITVDDPVKKVEQTIIPGVNGGFVTYRVLTKTSLEIFANKETSVRRRFRDFVALHELLKATHRGYIIPPRPEKNTVEGQRATEEFVEGRRINLQRYMNQLACHPVIGQSQELRVFLEAEGPLNSSMDWQQLQPLHGSFLDGAVRLPKQLIGQDRAILTPSESARSTKSSGDLLRRFKEMRQSVKNEHIEPPRLDAEETSLRDETKQLEDLQERVAEASRKAERVVARMDEAGNALGDFGLSLIKLSKFEDDEGAALGQYTQQGVATKHISADCRRAGMASVRLSRLAKAANEQTIAALEPLHTNLALCPAVIKALREREAQLLTVQAIEADIAKKQKALVVLEEQGQRTFGNEVSRGKKQEAIENDIAALEMALESAKTELRKITTRNQEELRRWEKDRRSEFAAMQESFLRVEAAFHERNYNVWVIVAEEFGAAK